MALKLSFPECGLWSRREKLAESDLKFCVFECWGGGWVCDNFIVVSWDLLAPDVINLRGNEVSDLKSAFSALFFGINFLNSGIIWFAWWKLGKWQVKIQCNSWRSEKFSNWNSKMKFAVSTSKDYFSWNLKLIVRWFLSINFVLHFLLSWIGKSS